MYGYTNYESPVGTLLLAANDKALVGLWIEGQKYHGCTMGLEMKEDKAAPILKATIEWLDRYFEGKPTHPSQLPLAPVGSTFRQQIWDILCNIPYGEVITYGAIAKQLAQQQGKQKFSAQAVGNAVAHNPISIIIPCHRVVGTNGSLTGYAGGVDIKKKLLEHEGVDMSHLFVPVKRTRE